MSDSFIKLIKFHQEY